MLSTEEELPNLIVAGSQARIRLVAKEGLEPSRGVAPLDFESSASANSATRPFGNAVAGATLLVLLHARRNG